MLMQWMAYATIIAALTACGALAVEQIVAIWGGGRRFVWIVALFGASLAPLALAVRRAPVATPEPDPSNAGVATNAGVVSLSLSSEATLESSRSSIAARAVRWFRIPDADLVAAWCVASAALLVLFVRATIALRARRAAWMEADLDGERVLVAADVGPAVIGAIRPRIVIPNWALELTGTERELMLRHEREHIRMRDPQLLIVAMGSLVVFPWNAALWLIVRRLRLAVEMDCDARVLRAANHPREYGLLLIAVGARQRTPFHLVASLAERRPLLERRIKAMTTLRPAYPRLATMALVVVAAGTTLAATRTPRPIPLGRRTASVVSPAVAAPLVVAASQQPTPSAATVPSPREVPANASRSMSTIVSTPREHEAAAPRPAGDLTLEEIRALVRQFYPSVFEGDSTIAMITFIVDANHGYLMSQTSPTAPDVDFTLTDGVGGRGGRGRGGAGLTEGMAPRTAEDSVKLVEMKVRLALLKARFDKVRGDTVVMADGRVFSGDKAALDSAMVSLKLARAKAAGRQNDVDVTVKSMLSLLRTSSGVRWTGVRQLQNRFGPGVVGPRSIVIVTVELEP